METQNLVKNYSIKIFRDLRNYIFYFSFSWFVSKLKLSDTYEIGFRSGMLD